MVHPAAGHPGTSAWGDGVDTDLADHTAAFATLPATYAPGVSVMAYGAVRDGTTLDTVAINAAITANPGKTICLPNNAAGTAIYLVDGAVSILLNQPGTKLVLDPGVTIKVKTNALDKYAAITISAADCSVTGGAILGDVGTHTGTTGEAGYGIDVQEAAHRATVNYTRITKCWGDGICVGDTALAAGTGAKPADILFQNVICDDNRRQGLSLVSALRPRVIGGSYSNTGLTAYTSPGAGIDIEPNSGCLQDVIDAVIIGPVLQGNHGCGFVSNPGGGRVASGVIADVQSLNNGAHGFMVAYTAAYVFNNCTSNGNSLSGFNQETAATTEINFNGCKADGNTLDGFVIQSGGTATGSRATNNGWSGFALIGAAATTACTAKGNNQTSNENKQFMVISGSAALLIGCVSDAGSNAVKPYWAYQIDGNSSNTNVIGCRAIGAFAGGTWIDQGTATNAFPMPGATKQISTPAAATDPATTMALVNDLRTKLLALGHIN